MSWRCPVIIAGSKRVSSRSETTSGQNWWSSARQNIPSRESSSEARATGPPYAGFANTRTNPFSVSGQVAQPWLRLSANQSCARS